MSILAPFSPSHDAPFDFARANRLLSRVGFGASYAQVQRAVKLGLEATVDELFSLADAPGSDARASEHLRGGQLAGARAWWLDELQRGVGAGRERLALFWHGHFATSIRKPLPLALMVRQIEWLRRHGMECFDVILREMATDPALILWLDAHQNVAQAPNENLAREILELFALGYGHYDQSDVRALSRALTGWQVDIDTAVLRPELHDHGRVRLLGRDDIADWRAAIDAVAASPQCARWIAGRLWEHYFGTVLRGQALDELAAEFAADGLHIGRLAQRIAGSRALLAPIELEPRVAAPVELAVVFARRLGTVAQPHRVGELAARMGQGLFAPPSVAGWPKGPAWLGSAWCLRRMELAAELLSDTSPSDEFRGADGFEQLLALFCTTVEQRAEVRASVARARWSVDANHLPLTLALAPTQYL